MRCFALAQALKKKRIDAIFIIRNYETSIKKLIQRYGYKVELIPNNINFLQEFSLILGYAKKYKTKILIVDLNNANIRVNLKDYGKLIKSLKSAGIALVSIDGFGSECIASKLELPFDIIIVPYYEAEKYNYKVAKKTKLLLGVDYFILRQDFIEGVNQTKKITKKGKNILVGKDLNKLNLSRFSYQQASNLSDKQLVRLMLWADLGIFSSGLIRYEAAALGLPCIIISHNTTHDIIMKKYRRANTCLYLGEKDKLKEEEIIKSIEKLLSNYDLRRKMSFNGKQLIDGLGTERTTEQIIRLTR